MKEKKKNERKLSPQELKRKAEFEKLSAKLEAEGYTPNHQTMGVVAANVLALIAAIPFIIPMVIIYNAMGNEFNIEFTSYELLLAAFVVFGLIIVHELIHGVTWAMFAESHWKSISFGVIWSAMTPYCTCSEPMKKHQIITGAIMPTIIVGIIPCIVAAFTGSSLLFLIGLFEILGGGGDIMIICKLLLYRSPSKDVLFIDHPYELGTAVFEKR